MKKVFEPRSSNYTSHCEIMIWWNAMVHMFFKRLVNSYYVWINIQRHIWQMAWMKRNIMQLIIGLWKSMRKDPWRTHFPRRNKVARNIINLILNIKMSKVDNILEWTFKVSRRAYPRRNRLCKSLLSIMRKFLIEEKYYSWRIEDSWRK